MRTLTIACLLALLGFVPMGLAPAWAEENRKFPYEADVEADDLHVRSGPGTRYYPTGRLHAGQRVKVRRHDPGGWLMIDPPEGSFSLVPANVVEKNDDQTGAIAGENIKVIMGGVHNETQGVTQRELNQGDLVEILGEMELTIGGPLQKWYKIRPPQGEFRWVAGQYVRPVGQPRTVHKPAAQKSDEPYDPFADEQPVPPKKSQPASEAPRKKETSSNNSLISRNGAIAQTGPTAEVLAAERERIRQLDQQWELMVQREPQHWQIDQMEQAYKQLQSELTATVLQRQIDLRLSTLKEHRKIYGDLAEFNRIKEQTDIRDAQLRGLPGPAHNHGPAEDRFERPLMQASAPNMNGQTPANPVAPASVNAPANNPSNVAQAGGTPAQAAPSGFIATGRLLSANTQTGGRLFQQKMPQLMIVNPNNQVIAFLHATPNVNLNPYLNRNVGIQGSRWNQPGVQYPVISVTQVVPFDQNGQPAPVSQAAAPQNPALQNPALQNNVAQPVAATQQQQPDTNTPNAAWQQPAGTAPYSYGQTIQTTPVPGNVQNATWTQQNTAMQQQPAAPQGITFNAPPQNVMPQNNVYPANNGGTVISMQQPGSMQQPAANWRPMTAPQNQPYQQLPYQQQYQQSNQYQQMQYQQPQYQQYQAGMPVYRNQAPVQTQPMMQSQPTQSMAPLPTMSLPFGYRAATNRHSNSQPSNGRPIYNGMNSNSMPINPLAN